MMLEEAIRIAVAAHAGQKDKAGAPYILHPLRIMMDMNTPDEMATAILHDVLEDSPVTGEDLAKAGIPLNVRDAVVCLTKREGEEYEPYLSRVELNALARAVKIADLRDNMRIERLESLTEKDMKRLAKYHKAFQQLSKPRSSASADLAGDS